MANTRTAKPRVSPTPIRGGAGAEANTIDLDADRAARAAKAEGQPFTVKLDGHTFTIPSMLEWPTEALDQFGGGTVRGMMDGFQLVLGEDWPRFQQAKPTIGDLVALARALSSRAGFDSMGESLALPAS